MSDLRDDLNELGDAWRQLKRDLIAALPPTVRGRLLLALGLLAAIELVVLIGWLFGVGS